MERHDLDITSLIAGLLFVALGILFLSDGLGALDVKARWIWPALLIGLGIALLASGRGAVNGANGSNSAGSNSAGSNSAGSNSDDESSVGDSTAG